MHLELKITGVEVLMIAASAWKKLPITENSLFLYPVVIQSAKCAHHECKAQHAHHADELAHIVLLYMVSTNERSILSWIALRVWIWISNSHKILGKTIV